MSSIKLRKIRLYIHLILNNPTGTGYDHNSLPFILMWDETIRRNFSPYEKKEIDAICFHKRMMGCVLPKKRNHCVL